MDWVGYNNDYNLYSESNHKFLKSGYNLIEPQCLSEIIGEYLQKIENRIECMKPVNVFQDFISEVYKEII